MSERHEIELFISDNGELKVHIRGIKGPSCLKILESLAKETGTIKEQKLSNEYYETPAVKLKQNSRINNT